MCESESVCAFVCERDSGKEETSSPLNNHMISGSGIPKALHERVIFSPSMMSLLSGGLVMMGRAGEGGCMNACVYICFCVCFCV